MKLSLPYLLAGLLVAGGCAKSPEDHAKELVAASLKASSTLSASYDPHSLDAQPFPADQVRYFTTDSPAQRGGYLVTYQVRGADGVTKQADFVTEADSVFTFIPFRHADEFRQRYGVSY